MLPRDEPHPYYDKGAIIRYPWFLVDQPEPSCRTYHKFSTGKAYRHGHVYHDTLIEHNTHVFRLISHTTVSPYDPIMVPTWKLSPEKGEFCIFFDCFRARVTCEKVFDMAYIHDGTGQTYS
jgi:hypothetical protein